MKRMKPVSCLDRVNAHGLGFDPENMKLQVKYTNLLRVVRRAVCPPERTSRVGGKVMLLIGFGCQDRGRAGVAQKDAGARKDGLTACLLLDQIKREKGVWWMPWQ